MKHALLMMLLGASLAACAGPPPSHALTVRHPELKCALIAFSGCGALVAPQPEQDAELGDEDAGVE